MSSVAKRKDCMMLCISNAGFVDSWQWQLRERVRQDPDWYFNALAGPQASWISEKILDEQRRLLPNIAFERLWNNVWSSGGGDALPEELAAFFTALARTGELRTAAREAGVSMVKAREFRLRIQSVFLEMGLGMYRGP